MSIESVNREFEVFIRNIMESHKYAKENVENDFRLLMERTVNSCAIMFGFSAKEALKRLDSNGNIVNEVSPDPKALKELEKMEKLRLKELEKSEKMEKLRLKELEKSEKLRAKELENSEKMEKLRIKELEKSEKMEKLRIKELEKSEKMEKLRLKELEKLRVKELENSEILRLKVLEKFEKINESSERSSMKEEDTASKNAEKQFLKRQNKEKKAKKAKKLEKAKELECDSSDCDSSASTVIMSDSEDDEPKVLFQNVKLIEEINSIRKVKSIKNLKKISKGVKLARQILDI
jgi:hypothetical protein